MPKGLTPKKRRLRKQMKPLKKPGTMKKIKSFLQPMSKGRGK